jgi:hypothetical protein
LLSVYVNESDDGIRENGIRTDGYMKKSVHAVYNYNRTKASFLLSTAGRATKEKYNRSSHFPETCSVALACKNDDDTNYDDCRYRTPEMLHPHSGEVVKD